MKTGWMQLLEDYGVDITKGGGADFAELVYRLSNIIRWTGKMPNVGEVVQSMAKERNAPLKYIYSSMKLAVLPVLTALENEGVPKSKLTSAALAAALAEKEEEQRKKSE